MLSVIVLVCAAAVGRSECTVQTALAVVADRTVESIAGCGFMGQAQAAAALQLRPGEYIKVICRRGAAPANEARLSP